MEHLTTQQLAKAIQEPRTWPWEIIGWTLAFIVMTGLFMLPFILMGVEV